MKIGLIAMSGIRVCDQELLRLGLTLPGFVERSQVIASLPSLGLLTLAGMTPAQHDVSYIEIPNLADVETLPGPFDLVAVSSYSAQINEGYDLARRYWEKGIPVVMGGPHVTALPEEALEYCDAVVAGEGEAVWLDILSDCEADRLSGVYGTTDNGFDLNDAPMPAFELLDIDTYNRLTVQTSRGCPHHCEFCGGSLLLTRGYKQKPVGNVVSEIDKILTIWKHPFIEFADDNSIVNKAYWRELLSALEKTKFRWFTETDLSVSEDEELLVLMRESGCAQVLIGLESPVQDGLYGLELHNDWKYNHWKKYKEAIRTIQSHGISVNGCFVIGLDGHTTDIFDQVIEFIKETELYEVQVTLMTAFPGTPLYERLKKEGRILEDKRWDKCTLFDINYQPSHMNVEELDKGFKQLVVDIYNDDFIRWRRNAFKQQLKKLAHDR
jgi:radical SAM superfamily enzyme YgiQ (UPF0313 family)